MKVHQWSPAVCVHVHMRVCTQQTLWHSSTGTFLATVEWLVAEGQSNKQSVLSIQNQDQKNPQTPNDTRSSLSFPTSFLRLLLATFPLIIVRDEMQQCVTAACTLTADSVSAAGHEESGPITHLCTYKGRPFVCCIFNGPKSFHNLNESRASSDENQGGKMSARKGRRELREKMSRSSISISLQIRRTHLVKLFSFSAASLSSSVRNQNTQQKEATETHDKR